MNTLPVRLTWRDLVRQEMEMPAILPQVVDFILWEHTAFPAGGVDTIRRQIGEFRDRQTAPAAPQTHGSTPEPREDT